MQTQITELTKDQIQVAKTWITTYINNNWLEIYTALKIAQINASEDGFTTEVVVLEWCRTFCLKLHFKKDEVTALQAIKDMANLMTLEQYANDLETCSIQYEKNSIEAITLFRDLFASLQVAKTAEHI